MEFKLLLQKSESELQRQLANLREQLRHRRFKVSEGQHKDVREIRELKHDIAQILTRLRQVHLAAKQPAVKAKS